MIQNPAETLDPVCGMTVEPQHAAGTSVYRGQTYYFCSQGCLAKFEANPERYLRPAAEAGPAQSVEYTCPMHSEVRQIGPGACPKCGMALEPVTLTASAGEDANPELPDMGRRFKLTLVLTLPLRALMFLGKHLP